MGHQASWRRLSLALCALLALLAFAGSKATVSAQDGNPSPLDLKPFVTEFLDADGNPIQLPEQSRPDTAQLNAQRPQLSAEALGEFTATDELNLRGRLAGEGRYGELAEGANLSGIVPVYVQLNSAPAGQVFLDSPTYAPNPAQDAMVANRAAALNVELGSLSDTLNAQFGAETVYTIQMVDAALVINVDARYISSIAQLPNVKRVVPATLIPKDHVTSVPAIGAPAAWINGTGITGQGVKVAVIDDGIDYTHVNFGGSGNVANFDGNDPTTRADFGFDGSFLVDGIDFAGDTGSLSFDDDPLPCQVDGTHGTHVAGTTYGAGVLGGTTYTGPYDGTTPFASMDIGPGVAPEAERYFVKIDLCENGESQGLFDASIIAAFNWVLDPNGDGDPSDRMDVTNSSFGLAYGTQLLDFDAFVFDIIAASGVIMVGSAGNEGDIFFVAGSPKSAPAGISVASSTHDTSYLGLEITTGPAGVYPAYPAIIAANPSTGGALGSHGPFSLKIPANNLGGNRFGCNIADYAGFAGEVALIPWDASLGASCGSGTRMTNAVNAGNVAGLLVVSFGDDFPFINLACTLSGGPSSIPCVSITNFDGLNLLNDTANFTVRFDNTLTSSLPFSISDQASGFTSRGPITVTGSGSNLNSILKPDLAAPGENITSSLAGSGNDTLTIGGTSMASPHVAGVMALLRQLHPDWSSIELKALVMNTAYNDLFESPGQTGDRYGVSRIGAGRVDVPNAIGSEVIAYDASFPERVSVSFGLVEIVADTTINRTITVENKGSVDKTYDVSFDTLNDTSAASFGVSPAQITVPAGGTVSVTVTLTVNRSASMPHTLDGTTTPTQPSLFGELPRQWIAEEGGYVVLTPVAIPDEFATLPSGSLRVPVHAIPRMAAQMASALATLPVDTSTGVTFVPLTGTDILTGFNFPEDVISTVTALQLVGIIIPQPPSLLDSSTVAYVGATSDYLSQLALARNNGDPTPEATAIANTTIYLGIATQGNWGTLTALETYFDMAFDVNGDGTFGERFLYVNESGFDFLGGTFLNDAPLAFLDAAGSPFRGTSLGSFRDLQFVNELSPSIDTYTHLNNVIVLPFGAAALGLTAADTDFEFDTFGLSRFFLGTFTGPFFYDVANPGVSFGDELGLLGGPFTGIPMWFDLDSNIIPVVYNIIDPANPPQILLLHHHGETGTRAEVVELDPTLEIDLSIAKTVNNNVPNVGDNVVFTITITNNGPATASEMVITDTLPAGLGYVSDTCPGVSTRAGAAITCDLTGFILPANSTGSYTITARVQEGATGNLINRVQIDSMSDNLTEIAPGDESGGVAVCINGTADECDDIVVEPGDGGTSGGGTGTGVAGSGSNVLLTITPSQSIIQPGDDLSWTVTVNNITGQTLTNAVIETYFSPGIQAISAQPGVGTSSIGTKVSRGNSLPMMGDMGEVSQSGLAQALVTWNVASIAPGEIVNLVIVTRVPANYAASTIVGTSVLNATNLASTATANAVVAIVRQLPATGETPFWRDWVLALAALSAGTVLVGGAVALRRRRQLS